MNDTDQAPLPQISTEDIDTASVTHPPADQVDLAPIDFERIEILAPAAKPEARPAAASGPVSRSVDARGSSAPLALLRLRQALLDLSSGEALLFHADCPDIETDLAAVAKVAAVVVAPALIANSYRISKR